MLGEIRRRVASAASLPREPRPLVLESLEADGRAHRAVLCDERRLADGRDLAWVGFFAAKRRDRDHAPLTLRDDELVQEFPAHPGILSYSSLELADGDWGNLILLEGDEAREHWRTSPRHADAVRELAPRHYTDVRLHLGIVPGGVLAARESLLHRTKYYDFRGGATWRAEREWRLALPLGSPLGDTAVGRVRSHATPAVRAPKAAECQRYAERFGALLRYTIAQASASARATSGRADRDRRARGDRRHSRRMATPGYVAAAGRYHALHQLRTVPALLLRHHADQDRPRRLRGARDGRAFLPTLLGADLMLAAAWVNAQPDWPPLEVVALVFARAGGRHHRRVLLGAGGVAGRVGESLPDRRRHSGPNPLAVPAEYRFRLVVRAVPAFRRRADGAEPLVGATRRDGRRSGVQFPCGVFLPRRLVPRATDTAAVEGSRGWKERIGCEAGGRALHGTCPRARRDRDHARPDTVRGGDRRSRATPWSRRTARPFQREDARCDSACSRRCMTAAAAPRRRRTCSRTCASRSPWPRSSGTTPCGWGSITSAPTASATCRIRSWSAPTSRRGPGGSGSARWPTSPCGGTRSGWPRTWPSSTT